MEILYHDIKRKEEVSAFISKWKDSEKHISCMTSGSTSEPKIILLSKDKMRISAKKTLAFFQITSNSNLGLALSCDTIAGKMMVVRAIEGNHILHVLPLSQNPLFEVKEKLQFISLVPSQIFSYLENLDPTQDDCTFLIGGAAISDSLEEKIANSLSKVYQSYGMTETYSHVALRHLNGKNQAYKALSNVKFNVRNGCLLIRADEFFDEPLLTNDLIALIDEQNFYFLGRNDFAINSGGYKIHPERVEHKLQALFKHDFMLVPVPHEKMGMVVGLLLTNSKDCDNVGAIFQDKTFQKYEVPKYYQQIPYLRLTSNGKLDRVATLEEINPNAWKSIL